jgi:hypothetical protein
MQSKNRYTFLIASLLVIALFYSSSTFRPVVALSTQDIMALNTNAEVLASKISLSLGNVTEQKEISRTNHTDSDLNNLDPFSTKDNGKIDRDSRVAIDEDSDGKDQGNKSSATKNIDVSCEKDDKRCKNEQDISRNEDNSKNEDGKDVKDRDTSNEEQGAKDGAKDETKNNPDEKKSSDRFELPIDIPFP